MSAIKTLGHLCLGSMFIFGGANAFLKPGHRPELVAAAGIPEAEKAVVLNGAIMTVAGTTLAVGIAPKLSALVLIASLIPTTLVGHPFWKDETPAARAGNQTQFMKNLSMLGGLILVLAE